MPFPRKIRFLIFACLILFAALILVLASLYFYIPTFVESHLIPRLAVSAGIHNFRCEVRRIGMTGADFGALRIGPHEAPALSIASVQIDYSPIALAQKKITRATFSGGELFCEFKKGKLAIRGFDFNKELAALPSKGERTAPQTDLSPPIDIASVEVRNFVLICVSDGKTYRLPVDMRIVPESTNAHVFRGTLRLYPRGQEIVFSARMQLNPKAIAFKFEARNLHIERFSDLAGGVAGLDLWGTADVQGQAHLRFDPLRIAAMEASGEFRNAGAAYANLRLNTSLTAAHTDIPFHVKIRSEGGKAWKISGSSIAMLAPIPFKLDAIHADLKILPEVLESSGNFVIGLDHWDAVKSMPVRLTEPIRVRVNFSGEFAKTKAWKFRMANAEMRPTGPQATLCRFRIEDTAITAGIPRFEISAQGNRAKVSARYKITLPDARATAPKGSLKIPTVTLTGDVGFDRSLGDPSTRATFFLYAPRTRITLDAAQIAVPDVALRGKLEANQGEPFRFEGTIKCRNASIADARSGLALRRINATIPLQWPCEGPGRKGKISVKTLQWRDHNLGILTGVVRQRQSGFIFSARHVSNLLPELILNVTGKSGISISRGFETELHFTVPRYQTGSRIELGQWVPGAKGITFDGKLMLEGHWSLNEKGMKSFLNADIQNANLRIDERNVAIEGIDLALTVPDLLALHSAPQQTLKFKKASWGELRVNDGKIEYQIESFRSIFIEKSRFKWCNGNVHTPALRISPGVQDYHVTLYCDRLDLAMILEQFGIARAEGKGTVNGRVPVRFRNGRLTFDDGFLFSTPGDGGTVRLTGIEALAAGIPTDTPQYAQVQIAIAALQDYAYEWVKLYLLTEGENLLLKVQFDGKPAKPLPFVYNRELGKFVKIKVGGGGSKFQGIRLDVNFRLPLDKILRYRDILEMME